MGKYCNHCGEMVYDYWALKKIGLQGTFVLLKETNVECNECGFSFCVRCAECFIFIEDESGIYVNWPWKAGDALQFPYKATCATCI